MRYTIHKPPSILTTKLQKRNVLPGVIQRMEAVMKWPFQKSLWWSFLSTCGFCYSKRNSLWRKASPRLGEVSHRHRSTLLSMHNGKTGE